MKRLFILLVTALITFRLTAENFRGPFRGDGLCYYFVHNGGALRLGVRVSAKNSAVVVRFYDAEENLVKWQYSPLNTFKHFYCQFPSGAKAGIYQIRVSGINIQSQPFSVPEQSFAIMPMRGHLRAMEPDQFSKVYFVIPKGERRISFDMEGVTVSFRNGEDRQTRLSGKKKIKFPEDQVWSAQLKFKPGKGYFGMNGFPVIYSPDRETAEVIGASLNEYRGRLYPHKFQCRMHEFVSGWTKKDFKVGKMPDLSKVPKTAVPFFYLQEVLESQNLDPSSSEFGYSLNPVVLAIAFSENKPWNPCYHDPGLARRIAAAAFYDLKRLHENDTFHTDGWGTYGAGDVVRAETAVRLFARTAGHIEDSRFRREWENGVRRIGDRYLLARESSASTSSRWPLVFYSLYKGTGEKGYALLASDFIKAFCLPENNMEIRTGYFRERGGPDAEYQARTVANLALYWRLTGDPNALNGVKRAFILMNHTVAPDPDGTIHGGNNFNHRTVYSWDGSRRAGGASLLGCIFPGSACWNPVKETNKMNVRNCTDLPSPWFTGYLFPSGDLRSAELPAAAQESFFRNFNNEFYAVKYPAWYLCYYTGSTARNWEWNPQPRSAENKKTDRLWYPSQGITLLWFPKTGTFLSARNWNGCTGHFLCIEQGRKKNLYPDYRSIRSFTRKNQIVTTGSFFGNKTLKFTRTIALLKNGVAQRIEFNCKRFPKADAVYDQLPILKRKDCRLEFFIHGQWTEKPGVASAVRYGNILIRLKDPCRCSLGPETTRGSETILPLRIHLDPDLAGSGGELIYLISLSHGMTGSVQHVFLQRGQEKVPSSEARRLYRRLSMDDQDSCSTVCAQKQSFECALITPTACRNA